MVRHLSAAAALAGLAVLHTWPLAARLDDVIPGPGLGDNVISLWSFWWMREALARPEVSFFTTSYLFAPAGTPLVLHTHMAPLALVAAALGGGLSLPASLNLVLIGAVFLNGATAYGLAFHLTRQAMPALLAGVLFMLAPPLLARLMGHFNLVQAWTLVLAAWLLLRMRSTPSAIAAGAALALVAWSDYYLFVYALGLMATLYAAEHWRVRVTRRAPRDSAAVVMCAALAMVCLAAAVLVLAAGGGVVTLAGFRVSMRSAENPLMAMWLLLLAAVVSRWRIRLRAERTHEAPSRPRPAEWRVAIATGALAVVPLAWMAVDLVLGGGYATQQSSWRTAPAGIDLATLVAGPPFHPLAGATIRTMYARAGIDVMESSAWLGVSACVLAALALRVRPVRGAARAWTAAGLVFFVWSLGPFLSVAGFNTWLVLPQQLLRYLPLLGNARMPARALIVVSLALAMLAAIWAAQRPRRAIAIAVTLVCLELIGAPLPVVSLQVPEMYRVLAAEPAGAVLELPLGFRDGFGETGDFDDKTLLYQTIHRHPMAGGFVARLSPAVRRAYDENPVLHALIAASGPASAPVLGCEAAIPALSGDGFRYVVIDRSRLTASLATLIAGWPLTPLAASDGREVFRLGPASACRPNPAAVP